MNGYYAKNSQIVTDILYDFCIEDENYDKLCFKDVSKKLRVEENLNRKGNYFKIGKNQKGPIDKIVDLYQKAEESLFI